jgi:hypothetical protein
MDEKRIFDALENESNASESAIATQMIQQDLFDRILRRSLRKEVKDKSFNILYAELVFLALLIIFQGFNIWNFRLENWVFGVITNVCILQTFLVIRYITIHLFPNNDKKPAL